MILTVALLIIAGILCAWALAFAAAAMIPAKKTARPFIKALKAPMVIAHRGDSRKFTENTMPAFYAAREAVPGCMLETDVWQTKDLAAVLSHDGTLESGTGETIPIGAMDLEQAMGMDAGFHITHDSGRTFPFRGQGHRVATLEQALSAFPDALFSIDIKLNSMDFAGRVMDLIKSHGAFSRVIIGSFYRNVLRFIRSEYPEAATGFSSRETVLFYVMHRLRISGFFRCGGDVMMIPEFSDTEQPEYLGSNSDQGFRVVSQSFIRDAHRAGYPVCVWTINREENMRRLVMWGADGIITDYPARLSRVISNMRV